MNGRRSGALRDRVKIFRYQVTGEDSRAGGKKKSRVEIADRRCSIEPTKSSEALTSQAQGTKVMHSIVFRFERGLLQAGDELVDQHQSPAVTYIMREPAINPGNENRWLVAVCELRGKSE